MRPKVSHHEPDFTEEIGIVEKQTKVLKLNVDEVEFNDKNR